MSSDKEDDDDALFDDESSEEESKKRKASSPTSSQQQKRKKMEKSFIDDIAEHSGEEEEDSDDEDEEEEGTNDYVKDGFVVDEVEEERKKDVLEDSDEDDFGDDDDDDDDEQDRLKRKRVKKLKRKEMLDEDDLALIHEARGEKDRLAALEKQQQERNRAASVKAQNEAELRKGLFYDSDNEIIPQHHQQRHHHQKARVERYDEDGMDDFIDDDIGDQGEIMASANQEYSGTQVSEGQLQEASEIFGTDFLDFMGQQQPQEEDEEQEDLLGRKYRERGVGVDMGFASDEEDLISEDDDDDLFGDDEDDDDLTGQTARQRAEALKLKREKREMAKKQRRKAALDRRNAKRKKQLKRAFEPVQLVENFCTDRDDEIRARDVPERYFDWNVPFHGAKTKEFSAEEEEEAMWIMNRTLDISNEFFCPPPEESEDFAAALEARQRSVLDSIIYALRFMHVDKFEPDFIKRYRVDYITSPSVRENLHAVMDMDEEWDQTIRARTKVDGLLANITAATKQEDATGVEQEDLVTLRQDLQAAQAKLDETLKQESNVKEQLKGFANVVAAKPSKQSADDDDDDLFGDDEDEKEQEQDEDEATKARRQEKATIESHLTTIQSLLQERAERVAQVASILKEAENRTTQVLQGEGPELEISKKMCRPALYNADDYEEYLSSLSDMRNILDMNSYLSLIKEGNDAIRRKEAPGTDTDAGNKNRKRSRRFNRDFYRTCVAEGLRSICYQFMLAPFRAGIKLEDTMKYGTVNYEKTLVGETDDGDPLKWVAPVIPDTSPSEFANKLIGSGDLVLLSSQGADADEVDATDPLRGCRYVAAMELAHEPRIRRYLRDIFRKNAVMTTVPTTKALEGEYPIDALHEFYGLHLIRDKPITEHFPPDEKDFERRTAGMGKNEREALTAEIKKGVTTSCLQYLNILKAEGQKFISVSVHMPLLPHVMTDTWYTDGPAKIRNRDNQNLKPLMDELERIYMPLDGDTEEWNEERRKVLRFALTNFLLPQFEAEARREIREASDKEGVMAAAANLQAMAIEGPLRPSSMLGENRFLVPTGDLPIVGVSSSADGKDATYLASVTERGELNDQLAIPSGHRVDDNKMREKVVNFLIHSRPAVVVVGAGGGLGSKFIVRKFVDLIREATERWNKRFIQGDDEDDEEFEARQKVFLDMNPLDMDDDESEWKCNVELVDDTVAQLFGESIRGKKEFPDAAVNLKIAIATARYAQDPLAELTYAWNVASDTGQFGTEMLFINIHPLQRLLPQTSLLRQYERVLCGAVADVGVDINTSCAHDHLLGLLSFVAGLGPRKAANLKQNVLRIGGVVSSRKELLAKRLLGPVVYSNAVAFLRIRDIEQLTNQFLHPLDDTRLHPDVYHRNNWAVKIAIDALEMLDDDGKKGADKEAVGIKALQQVMENSAEEIKRLYDQTKLEFEQTFNSAYNGYNWDPKEDVPSDLWRDKVEELDLETFAGMLAENGSGKWLSHLLMIKWEFRQPFRDPRKPMAPLSGDKLFRLLTGESDVTLRPGQDLTGTVTENGDSGSRVKLNGVLPAFVPLRNITDGTGEVAPEDMVNAGESTTFVVSEVKKDHLSVDLSLKIEDLRRRPSSWGRPSSLPPIDLHFDTNAANRIETAQQPQREAMADNVRRSRERANGGANEDAGGEPKNKRTGRVTRRACAHPAFRNARHNEVDRELREAGDSMVGEALIRPSSKSSDSLAVHWVVKPGTIKIIEVAEEEKDTDASIGKVLKVKDEKYGSIDELLGRNISPMNDFVEELTHHRKFVDLSEDEVDAKLKEQKEANPTAVFYSICWDEMHPGYASLRFITGSTPRAHHIGIAWNGFTWGPKTYSNLDKLLNDFKKNPRGVSSSRSVASGSLSVKPASVPASIGDAAAKPSRWGAKSAVPPAAPMAPPVDPWAQQPTRPAVPAVAATGAANLPPLPNHFQPPPPGLPFQPPPPSGPPPPAYGQPRPPPPPPPFGQRPPPPPPSGPPPPLHFNSYRNEKFRSNQGF